MNVGRELGVLRQMRPERSGRLPGGGKPLDRGVGRDNSRERRSCEKRCQARHAHVFMLRKESNLSEHGIQRRDGKTSPQSPLKLFDLKVF